MNILSHYQLFSDFEKSRPFVPIWLLPILVPSRFREVICPRYDPDYK